MMGLIIVSQGQASQHICIQFVDDSVCWCFNDKGLKMSGEIGVSVSLSLMGRCALLEYVWDMLELINN